MVRTTLKAILTRDPEHAPSYYAFASVMRSRVSSPDRHPDIELVRVTGGALILCVGTWYDLLFPGDLVLYDANALHVKIPLVPRCARTAVIFTPQVVDEGSLVHALARRGGFHRLPQDDASGPDAAYEPVSTLFDTLGAPRPDSPVLRFSTQLVSGRLGDDAAPKPAPIVHEFMRYALFHAETSDRLPDIAEAIGSSHSHLRALVRRSCGCSLGQIWQRVRIARVFEKILYSEVSVGEIARMAGYSGARGLQRAFHLASGRTVDAYRQTAAARLVGMRERAHSPGRSPLDARLDTCTQKGRIS